MAEIVDFRWPDEVSRFFDPIDETPVVERQTGTSESEISLLMSVFKTGRFKRADLSLDKSNGLILGYTFTGSFAGISGSYRATDLGTVEYDKNGYICRVALQPVERLDKRFWREYVPEKVKHIIEKEDIERIKTFNDLRHFYGAEPVPSEVIRPLYEMCTVTNKYRKKFERFEEKEADKAPVLVRDHKQWQLEPSKPVRGGAEPILVHWGEWIIYRGEAICVDILNDDAQRKFRFRQMAVTENYLIESKSVIVPRKIDYELCRRLVHTKNSWQDLFSVYPVELEFYNNSLIGKSG